MSYRILVINPGSTSTKIGVFEDETLLFDKTLRHSAEDIAQFNTIPAQKDWRRDLVMKALREQGFDPHTLSAVSGRGGLLLKAAGCAAVLGDEPARAGHAQHGLVHLSGERALQGENMGRAEPRRAAGLQRSRQRQHARPAARSKVRQGGKLR